MASWATRTPAIRDILSVSIAEMGGVLFGLSIGSMSGILCSAWLVKRFGTRNVILVTMSCALIGMMILSLALWLTSPVLFAVGLGVFGASFGSAEVAINVEGAAVEREMNKTVLPMMHGFYSLGTLAGAGVGMALTAFGVPATVHILLAALVGIDQLIKLWAVQVLQPVGAMPLIPHVVELRFVLNQGMAFSLLSGKQLFLLIATSAALLAVAYGLFFRSRG